MAFSFEAITSADYDASPPATEPARLLVCTTPRTAGHAFCELLLHAGWGVPTEYFLPDFALRLYGRWVEPTNRDFRTVQRNARRYGAALFAHRTRHDVFAAKVFFDDLTLLDRAIGRPRDRTWYVRLSRADRKSQVLSIATTLLTRQPFDDATVLPNLPFMNIINEVNLAAIVRWLQTQDAAWTRFFGSIDATRRIDVETETFLSHPAETVRRIAERFGLAIIDDIGPSSVKAVQRGPYAQGAPLKHQLEERYGRFIEDLLMKGPGPAP